MLRTQSTVWTRPGLYGSLDGAVPRRLARGQLGSAPGTRAVLMALPIAWAAAGVEAQAAPVEPEVVAETDSMESEQAALDVEREDVAAAASIESELQAAVGLHVVSAILVTAGAFAIPFGAMGLSTEGDEANWVGFVEFVSGLIAVPLGVIALAIAIGLEVDGVSRRNSLRQRVSVSAGPVALGLSLSVEL